MRNKHVSTTPEKKQSLTKMTYTRKPIKMNEIAVKGAWVGGSKVNKWI